MGKSDIAVKRWLRNKERFADLFNGIVFSGKTVILPEDLEEVAGEADIIVIDKNSSEKGVQKYRDITMRWEKGAELSILACENQKKVHYAMPVRMMLYDSLSYIEQVRQVWKNRDPEVKLSEEEYLSGFRKEDKIYPVISLVFYYGLAKWDGSTDLYGMFHQGNLFQNNKILHEYIPNYALNFIDAGNIKHLERFRTDLQLIFGMLQYKDEIDKLHSYVNKHKSYFENVDLETYQAVRELLHSERKLKGLVKQEKGRESVNMCKALDDLYNSGVNLGIEKGVEKGLETGIRVLIETCKEFGVERQEILKRIEQKFSVTGEAALSYMEQYEKQYH